MNASSLLPARPGFAAAPRRDILSLLLDAAGATVRWLARHYQRRRAIAHLSSLPDHCLRDVGLHRSQIVSAVNGVDHDRARRSFPY
ncbi:MAG: DUF1127 domain-containing protein [Rhodospirillaceae bacterium]|nr:DUF1127 domain-containing protein [Rhodospirillaceae bacterium]